MPKAITREGSTIQYLDIDTFSFKSPSALFAWLLALREKTSRDVLYLVQYCFLGHALNYRTHIYLLVM